MDSTYLYHAGIKGQKWGLRRYRNTDGTLTPEGRKRYGLSETRKTKLAKDTNLGITNKYQNLRKADKQIRARQKNYDDDTSEIVQRRKSKLSAQATVLARSLGKPVYSVTGRQTSAAIAFIEKQALSTVASATISPILTAALSDPITNAVTSIIDPND